MSYARSHLGSTNQFLTGPSPRSPAMAGWNWQPNWQDPWQDCYAPPQGQQWGTEWQQQQWGNEAWQWGSQASGSQAGLTAAQAGLTAEATAPMDVDTSSARADPVHTFSDRRRHRPYGRGIGDARGFVRDEETHPGQKGSPAHQTYRLVTFADLAQIPGAWWDDVKQQLFDGFECTVSRRKKRHVWSGGDIPYSIVVRGPQVEFVFPLFFVISS